MNLKFQQRVKYLHISISFRMINDSHPLKYIFTQQIDIITNYKINT